MAEYYGVAVIPARSAAPRDTAKAENGVLVAERWILARLRNRTFFSIGELNEAIGELLDATNDYSNRSPATIRRGGIMSDHPPPG